MNSVNSELNNFKREFRGGKMLFLTRELEILQIAIMFVLMFLLLWLTPLGFISSFGIAFLSAIAIANFLSNSKLRFYVVDYKGVSIRFGFIKVRLFKFKDIKSVYIQKYTTGHELIFVEMKGDRWFIKERVISCDNTLDMVMILSDWTTR